MNAEKKTERLSLAFETAVRTRLATCATRTKLKSHSLAQAAIEAALEAIEAAGYRVVMPLEFRVMYVPTLNPAPNHLILEEPPVAPASTKRAAANRKNKAARSPAARE